MVTLTPQKERKSSDSVPKSNLTLWLQVPNRRRISSRASPRGEHARDDDIGDLGTRTPSTPKIKPSVTERATERPLPDEAATRALGADLAKTLKAGDVLLLTGELGAGKTVLARGLLAALGWTGDVRSPSYSLIQTYPTDPPVLHADLYRVASAVGLGLEDDLPTHLALIEWPDRLDGLIDPDTAWSVELFFDGEDAEARAARITPPVT